MTYYNVIVKVLPRNGQRSGCEQPGPFRFPAQQGSLPQGGDGILTELKKKKNIWSIFWEITYFKVIKNSKVGERLKTHFMLPWLPPCPVPWFPWVGLSGFLLSSMTGFLLGFSVGRSVVPVQNYRWQKYSKDITTRCAIWLV